MPTCTMPLIGRLGNLLFQYCWLRAWAEQNGYEISLPPWIGERVFAGVPEAVRPDKYKSDKVFPEDYCQRQECLIYTRKQVREWFAFKPDVLERLQPAKCKKEIVLNVRVASDYVSAGMVCLSADCYMDECERLFKDVFDDDNKWEFEFDTFPTKLSSFTGGYWDSGLGTTEVCLPSFYKLITAPILFRANSTFSWFAAALGNGRVFSPVIEGMKGGIRHQHCRNFVEGNWPRMSQLEGFTDLHLKES